VPDGEESWWKNVAEKVLSAAYLKWRLVEETGENYLDQSPMVGGSDGFVFWESDIVKPNGEMELVVTYGVKSISDMIGFPYFRMVNQYYGHAWTGYLLAEEGVEVEKQTVYITDNAEVYHVFLDCTHLKLNIREIWDWKIEEARNLYGGRYGACEKCAEGSMPRRLYIADEGDCYHYVRECPGLKRTIHVIKRDDVKNLPLCERCSVREE